MKQREPPLEEYDFHFRAYGSITVLTPLRDAAREWIDENVDYSADTRVLTGETGMMLEIVRAMIVVGLTCPEYEQFRGAVGFGSINDN